MATYWNIELLGGFSVARAGERTTKFATHKTAALLAYLAYYRKKPHLRESLAEMLWPDADPSQGRSRLSTLLSYLRHLLEPPGVAAGALLVTDRTTVRLNAERITTDVALWETLAARAAKSTDASEQISLLQQARRLYKGDLLPGFYDAWAVQEQAILREKHTDRLHALALGLSKSGDYSEAVAVLDEAIAADPYRESLVRLQMRCYGASGRIETALETYQRLADRLREDLSALPAAVTRALAERMRSEPSGFTIEEDAMPEATPLQPLPLPAAPSLSGGGYHAVSLPLQMGRFFGRASEIDQILGWIAAGERLITLTGAGGTGKTRMAIETAGRAAERFKRRVWFVDLTRVLDPRLLGLELGHALSLPPTQNADALEQAAALLSEAPSILVLDNFEHLLASEPQETRPDRAAMPPGASFARLLLERVPSLTLLVTSRQSLRLGGEQEFALPVLPVPGTENTPDSLIEIYSVALYVDRARAVRPDFALTQNNCAAVSALCRKLDGMPLAIEMAAAWAKTITPPRMLERLEQQFSSLSSRRRDVPDRHKSLHAAIEWSFDLLSEDERILLARLSVFHGGCTPEDAQAVCRVTDVVAGLAELQERSLVVGEERDGEIRFRMLEPIRAFAAEQLEARGETLEMRRRHFDHFLQIVDHAKDKLFGPESVFWFRRLVPEQDNLRFAMDNTADKIDRLRMITWFFRFWYDRGNYEEALRRLNQGWQEAQDAPEDLRAHALNGLGMLCNFQGMFREAEAYFTAGLEIWEARGDRKFAAKLRNNLGALYYRQGNLERAREQFENSLEHQQQMGERFGCAVVLYNLGCVACEQGDIPAAGSYHRESLEIKRAMNDVHGVAAGLAGLGNVAYIQGDYPLARALLQESVSVHRQIDLITGAGYAEMSLALVEYQSGHCERALVMLQESLRYWEEINDNRSRVCTLAAMGAALLELQRYEDAAARYEASIALNREVGDRSSEAQGCVGLARLAQRESRVQDALQHYRQALFILTETIERQTIAMILIRIAETLAEAGSFADARSLLKLSDGIYQSMGCSRPRVLDPCYFQLQERLLGMPQPDEDTSNIRPEYAEAVGRALRAVSRNQPTNTVQERRG